MFTATLTSPRRLPPALSRLVAVLVLAVAALGLAAAATTTPAQAAGEDNNQTDYSFYALAGHGSNYLSWKTAPGEKGLPDVWVPMLASPARAGALLGYPDPAYKGPLSGWSFSALAKSSSQVSYDFLANVKAGKDGAADTSGLVNYAYFGAANQALGFDDTVEASDAIGKIIGGLIGIVTIIAYILSFAASLLMWVVLQILQALNPFKWFYLGIAQVDNESAGGGYQTALANAMVRAGGKDDQDAILGVGITGIADWVSGWYKTLVAMSWGVVMPLFLAATVISVMFVKNGRGRAIKRYVIRILFLGLGLPLVGSMYSATLDSFSQDLGSTAAPTKAVLRTYVNFEGWARNARLYAPPEANIAWDPEQRAPTLLAQESAKRSAVLINSYADRVYSDLGANFDDDSPTSFVGDSASWTDTDNGIGLKADGLATFGRTVGLIGDYLRGKTYSASELETEYKASVNGLDNIPDCVKSVWFGSDKNTDTSSAIAQSGAMPPPGMETDLCAAEMDENSGLTQDASVPGAYNKTNSFGERAKINPVDHALLSVPDGAGLTATRDEDSGAVSFHTKGGSQIATPDQCGVKVADPATGRPLPCNLSPLAMYNYLETTFGSTDMTINSAQQTATLLGRTQHTSVSVVGIGTTGRLLNQVNTISILLALIVIGFGYALGLLAGSLGRGFKLVTAVPFATLGVMSGIAKVVTYAIALILEILVTVFMYTFSSEVIMQVDTLIQAPLAAFQNVVGKTASAAITIPLLYTYYILSTLIILLIAFQLVRMRKKVLEAIDQSVTGMIDRFLETKTDTSGNHALAGLGGGLAAAGAGALLGAAADKGRSDSRADQASRAMTNVGGTNDTQATTKATKAAKAAGKQAGTTDSGPEGTSRHGPDLGGTGTDGKDGAHGPDDDHTGRGGEDRTDRDGGGDPDSEGRFDGADTDRDNDPDGEAHGHFGDGAEPSGDTDGHTGGGDSGGEGHLSDTEQAKRAADQVHSQGGLTQMAGDVDPRTGTIVGGGAAAGAAGGAGAGGGAAGTSRSSSSGSGSRTTTGAGSRRTSSSSSSSTTTRTTTGSSSAGAGGTGADGKDATAPKVTLAPAGASGIGDRDLVATGANQTGTPGTPGAPGTPTPAGDGRPRLGDPAGHPSTPGPVATGADQSSIHDDLNNPDVETTTGLGDPGGHVGAPGPMVATGTETTTTEQADRADTDGTDPGGTPGTGHATTGAGTPAGSRAQVQAPPRAVGTAAPGAGTGTGTDAAGHPGGPGTDRATAEGTPGPGAEATGQTPGQRPASRAPGAGPAPTALATGATGTPAATGTGTDTRTPATGHPGGTGGPSAEDEAAWNQVLSSAPQHANTGATGAPSFVPGGTGGTGGHDTPGDPGGAPDSRPATGAPGAGPAPTALATGTPAATGTGTDTRTPATGHPGGTGGPSAEDEAAWNQVLSSAPQHANTGATGAPSFVPGGTGGTGGHDTPGDPGGAPGSRPATGAPGAGPAPTALATGTTAAPSFVPGGTGGQGAAAPGSGAGAPTGGPAGGSIGGHVGGPVGGHATTGEPVDGQAGGGGFTVAHTDADNEAAWNQILAGQPAGGAPLMVQPPAPGGQLGHTAQAAAAGAGAGAVAGAAASQARGHGQPRRAMAGPASAGGQSVVGGGQPGGTASTPGQPMGQPMTDQGAAPMGQQPMVGGSAPVQHVGGSAPVQHVGGSAPVGQGGPVPMGQGVQPAGHAQQPVPRGGATGGGAPIPGGTTPVGQGGPAPMGQGASQSGAPIPGGTTPVGQGGPAPMGQGAPQSGAPMPGGTTPVGQPMGQGGPVPMGQGGSAPMGHAQQAATGWWGPAPVQQAGGGAPVQHAGGGAPVQHAGGGAPVQHAGGGAPVQHAGGGRAAGHAHPGFVPQPGGPALGTAGPAVTGPAPVQQGAPVQPNAPVQPGAPVQPNAPVQPGAPVVAAASAAPATRAERRQARRAQRRERRRAARYTRDVRGAQQKNLGKRSSLVTMFNQGRANAIKKEQQEKERIKAEHEAQQRARDEATSRRKSNQSW